MEQIILDEGTSSGPPAVKLRNIGDHVDVGIVRIESRDATDIDGKPLINEVTGRPKKEEVITAVVKAAAGAVAGGDEELARPGDTVRIFLRGFRLKAWIDAKADLRANHGRGLSVGDVARFRFAEEQPASKRGYNPLKVWEIALRPPKDDESALVSSCHAAYQAATAIPLEPAPSGVVAHDDDLDPF